MKRSFSDSNESTESKPFAENIKIIIIGDASTGKSTFTNLINYSRRLKNYKFDNKYNSTENFNINLINLNTNKGNITFHLWDTAGQERYGPIRDSLIKGADGALVFYDISERQTIENVPKWLKQIKKIQPNIPVAVVGNKSDKFPNIQQAESVKIRECNLIRDIGHTNIKNFIISIKHNIHLTFEITGFIFSSTTVKQADGCMQCLEYLLSNICKTNITIE